LIATRVSAWLQTIIKIEARKAGTFKPNDLFTPSPLTTGYFLNPLRGTTDPGLTAGPTHCRLFEAGLEVIANLVLKPNGQKNQAQSAGS
jgi:hypothetical protein